MIKKTTHKETRIDNRLNNFGLRGLTAMEQNLWWALVQLIKDRGTKILWFSRQEVESLSGFNLSNKSKKSFVNTMENIGAKLVAMNTNFYEEETSSRVMFALFPVFKVNEEGVELEVSRYFEPWFNNIQRNFTRIDLSVLVGIKSGYSKEIYRFLMQWKMIKKNAKYPGFWSVSISDFRRLMCVPGSYGMRDIRKLIIEPALIDLTEKTEFGFCPLDYIDVKYIIKKGTKKKVERLEWTFKQGSPTVEFVQSAREKTQELLPLGSFEITYENNFKNDYIPGKNSPTKVFKAWLEEVNLFKDNDEYFEMRSKSRTDLMSIYKSKVIDADNKYWTDMRFFASAYSVIINDKAMTSWNIEDAYSEIRKGKRLEIPQEIYSSLPEDKGNQLQAFALKGEIA